MNPIQGITIALHTLGEGSHRLYLEGPRVGERRAGFAPPYNPELWQAIALGLDPTFDVDQAPHETQAALQRLGYPERLHQTVGAALAGALLADEQIALGFDSALASAEAARQPLPVELRFGEGSDALAALPWELLYHGGRFLVADTSIVLTRYPEGAFPPTRAMANLPLRVLLVLSDPVGAPPILPQQARRELLHGLRSLDEVGAVVVDLLRPPTYATLVEALTGGGYHLLAFYGHGLYTEEAGGCLVFEDPFGGPDLVPARELGAALRNTEVRLALIGAAQSARTAASDLWAGAAPALLRAGVPLAVGMQTSMGVDAALAFIRQFALSLAAGETVMAAVAQARKPLARQIYGNAWFIPALYGRPAAEGQLGTGYRLFDPEQPLSAEMESVRAQMQARRAEIAALETAIGEIGLTTHTAEMARLREARAALASTRAELARRTPGGYAAVTSPLYGVPSNPVFVGRVPELREVGRELAGDRPVVIWGAGGIGKTALAIEVAHRQSWRFPGGVLWLDCRGGPAWDSLLDRIGSFCGIAGVEQLPPAEKEGQVRMALAAFSERCLLVWDNAEDVWARREVRSFVENLPPNCQALITTREDPQAQMWPTVELRPLADEAMTELFYRLAEAARVKVGSQADLDCIPLIIDHLEGHPLALTLIVPLAKVRGLSRTWRELERRPPRGVEAAFALSYERLSGVQQRLFARLSVLTIPFEWEAAEALLPGEEDAGDALEVLVARALIAFDGAWYAYHALLRQYAYATLQEMEDPRPAHRLAAEHLQAKLIDPKLGGVPEEALEEVDQWQQAADWEQMARRASALVGSLDRLGYWGEIRQRLEAARAAVQQHMAGRSELDALLLVGLGTIAARAADWDRAITFYERALAIQERMGDIQGMAGAYNDLGLVYASKGEWDRAVAFYERSLAFREQLGDIPGTAATKSNLGNVYARKGEGARAIRLYEQALAIYRQEGDVHGIAETTNNLGLVYARTGEWDRAVACYQEALATMEQVGNLAGIGGTYNNLGLIYASKGEWDRAIEFYERALVTKERLGDAHGMAQTANNLGLVYAEKAEWEQAIACYRQALETMEQVGDVLGTAQPLANLGSICLRQGEWDQAIGFYEQSLAIKQQAGDVPGMAQTYSNLGSIYVLKGDWDRAVECYERALETLERVGDIHGAAQACNGLGLVYAERGQWDQAITFYERALDTMNRLGDIHGMAETTTNLGLVYADKGELDRAIACYEQALQAMDQIGDVHGKAQIYGNLGLAYADKGEWHQALAFYERDLAICEQMEDIHGIASAWTNIGWLYLQTDRPDEAKPLLGQAYLILAQLGSPNAQTAANGLIEACGSEEAANAYLAQLHAEMTAGGE